MGYGIAASTETQGPALVGTLVSRKAQCWCKAHAVEAPDWAKHRIQHTFAGGGRGTGLHIITLYCPCDDPTGATDLVAIALAAAESLGKVPVLICGDFNVDLKETHLESGLSWAGWEDLAAGFGHTCEASNGSYSKIDYMLANPAARAICTAAEVDRDTGRATHAYLQATFALGRRALGPIQRITPSGKQSVEPLLGAR